MGSESRVKAHAEMAVEHDLKLLRTTKATTANYQGHNCDDEAADQADDDDYF